MKTRGSSTIEKGQQKVARVARRLINAQRKLLAGLPLFGENVSPEVPNDLYQAHRSIYYFFAGFCAGKVVLDLGCGCGYGPAMLVERGARSVIALDNDRRSIRYAKTNFLSPLIQFRVANIESLDEDIGQFDVVTSSNVFEHLHDVDAGLDEVRRLLKAGGEFLLAVPPILDEHSLRANQAIHFHKSNLFIEEWFNKLAERFNSVIPFAHQPPADVSLNFEDPFPSSVVPAHFRFHQITVGDLRAFGTLTAIFVCR